MAVVAAAITIEAVAITAGAERTTLAIKGTVPGRTLRLKEGEDFVTDDFGTGMIRD